MKKLEINLENCYGIRRFNHTFNFNDSKTQLVYATNGVMKSSLALTFEDIAEGRVSKDRIFSKRVNKREVLVDDVDIDKDVIFVIQRMKPANFKEVSTILANEKLKTDWELINSKLNESKIKFLNNIQSLFGIKIKQVEEEIISIFSEQELFKTFQTIELEIEKINEPDYTNIIYSDVFNEKTKKFFESNDFISNVKEYIEVYERLVHNNTSLFMKGTFNHYNANTVTKSLKDNNFFYAKHRVKIKDQEINNAKDLEDLIISEKAMVLGNPDLIEKFNNIDKSISNNRELRQFKKIIEENQEIINELEDLSKFKKKLIINYLAKYKNDFKNLLNQHNETSEKRKKIISEAKKEQEDWKTVIDIFKRRFTVPFEVLIDNQEDVILKNEPASLLFKYTDGNKPEDTVSLGGPKLQESLSTGEQRVFYLLQIIFQFETRKKLDKNQLVIVDDIADSFDYKNKYAIIEYLKDVLDDSRFFMIVLTHNFDFYKTIKNRFDAKIKYHGIWTSIRKAGEIKLTSGERVDVFPNLRSNYSTCDFTFIACIPFVRNLIEFTIGDDKDEYLLLTSLLHIKPERADKNIKKTEDLTIESVLTIFNSIFKQSKTKENLTQKVYDLILVKAEVISNLLDENPLDIKYKICISIGIRLIAEKFMISKITDREFLQNILKKVTGKIIEKYRTDFPTETVNIAILDRVNLMTAENIHINSFMYEPLMDLTDDHLKTLYRDVKTLH